MGPLPSSQKCYLVLRRLEKYIADQHEAYLDCATLANGSTFTPPHDLYFVNLFGRSVI